MIFLPTSSLANELAGLARDVRDAHRAASPARTALAAAIPIRESRRGDGTAIFTIPVGDADRNDALVAFTEISRRYPHILDLLTRMTRERAATLTIEISQSGQGDLPPTHGHERFARMPRLLARFRGATT